MTDLRNKNLRDSVTKQVDIISSSTHESRDNFSSNRYATIASSAETINAVLIQGTLYSVHIAIFRLVYLRKLTCTNNTIYLRK